MSTAPEPSPFVFGVASGDVSDSAVVLWAKVTTPGATVGWYCKRDGDDQSDLWWGVIICS